MSTVAQRAFIEQQLSLLPATSSNRRLTIGLHLLYATGLRLSEVVAATVDDLQWVEYPADASDDEPTQGWLLKVIGKGQKEREVPVPIEVIRELAKYLVPGARSGPGELRQPGKLSAGQGQRRGATRPGLEHRTNVRTAARDRRDDVL